MRRRWLCAALVVAGVASGEEAAWERVTERDGILIERRAGETERVHEMRARAHSPLPPAAIMATLWKHEEYADFVPYLKRLDVLRDDDDTKLVYEQIRVPLLKDRDATLRVTRSFSSATGLYEITSVAVPDEGPPEDRNHVRVRTSAAHWRLGPADDGGTDVVYTIRTDVGGLVPTWIVTVAQRDAITKVLRAMLERARRTAR